MAAGKTFPDEREMIVDEHTGRKHLRLTRTGRNKHLYLYVDTFDKRGRLVYISDRDGALNYYRMDLTSGISTQLTAETEIAAAGLAWHSPAHGKLIYWAGHKIQSLDTESLAVRTITDYPRFGGYLTMTADAKYVVTYYDIGDTKDSAGRNRTGPWGLFAIAADGEESDAGPSGRLILQTPFLINHLQASPTDPNLLEYCWEWNKESTIPQRMWATNIDGTRGGAFGRQAPNTGRVHEFWFRDGSHMGYHGRRKPPGAPDAETTYTIGTIASNGLDVWQIDVEDRISHCAYHPGRDMWVTDRAGDFNGLAIIRVEGKGAVGRFERLCLHNSTWKSQGCHPHPQFSLDGDQLVWTSDGEGVSQVYLMEI